MADMAALTHHQEMTEPADMLVKFHYLFEYRIGIAGKSDTRIDELFHRSELHLEFTAVAQWDH